MYRPDAHIDTDLPLIVRLRSVPSQIPRYPVVRNRYDMYMYMIHVHPVNNFRLSGWSTSVRSSLAYYINCDTRIFKF